MMAGEIDRHFIQTLAMRTLAVFKVQMVHRLVGKTSLNGVESFVVLGVGNKPAPRGYWRLWICPDHAYAVARAEILEVGANGLPGTCVIIRATQFRDYGDQLWIPSVVEEQTFRRQEGGLRLLWTKRFEVAELAINGTGQLTLADFMFPVDHVLYDTAVREPLWDGGEKMRARLETLPPPEPDAVGAELSQVATVQELEELLGSVP